ncbi:response regulator transcription factor [Sulfurovum riftiae]|uniref:response regulator transcription factor n=1 Tax=Sulfurovum riftiae TaxID=1630136 RepID=UPI00082CB8AE|nr:response regulator transcription factor [Sulfurovum riftiae]
MTRLLLLEDDPNLSKTLMKYLKKHSYDVDWAKTGEEAMELSYDTPYDLYLFDINVPLINGIDLLSELRNAEDFTPTIIISALVDIGSITRGFIAGADDYLKKPFDPEELLVRIKAKTSTLKEVLKFRNFVIDMQKDEIFKDGEQLFLGEVQKNLLLSLIKNHPNPVTKEELLLLHEKPSDLALRVNIAKLKKSLGVDIENVRGVGYKVI